MKTLPWRELAPWIRRPACAIVIVIILFAMITIVDTFTTVHLNLQIMYFLPIMFAVWVLGRPAALLTGVAAVVPYYFDQVELYNEGLQSATILGINVLARVLVFLFVVEVSYRLVENDEKSKAHADALAALNSDLKQTYAHLDDDLNAARLLQSAAMSVEPVEAPGCSIGMVIRYAGKIGGDYADAGIMNGGVYACVGDISGKGTPAALFTTLLKYLISEAVAAGQHSGEVIESIRTSLRAMLPADMFVTLFYAELDRATGVLECVNAGHPDAYIWRRRTGSLEPVEHTAPVLGSMDIPGGIGVTRSILEQGDTLVIYSDGATDSKGLDGSRLGWEPIKQAISHHAHMRATDMAEAIVAEIESLSRGTAWMICRSSA